MKNKYYAIFGVLFLLLSLGGAIYLSFQNADTRDQATSPPRSCTSKELADPTCKPVSEQGVCGNEEGPHCEGNKWCKPYRLELQCGSEWCCKGTDYRCQEDSRCSSPTSTPIPTNTPTPTTPVNTPTPTSTVVIPTPTNTPTNTPIPTGTIMIPTPTNTSAPTNTPTPPVISYLSCGYTPCDSTGKICNSGLTCITANNSNQYCTKPELTEACKVNPGYASCCTAPVVEGPSPTRIILPVSGVNFPVQALTIVGGITTLLGFLILL